jgi:hypothetical protein
LRVHQPRVLAWQHPGWLAVGEVAPTSVLLAGYSLQNLLGPQRSQSFVRDPLWYNIAPGPAPVGGVIPSPQQCPSTLLSSSLRCTWARWWDSRRFLRPWRRTASKLVGHFQRNVPAGLVESSTSLTAVKPLRFCSGTITPWLPFPSPWSALAKGRTCGVRNGAERKRKRSGDRGSFQRSFHSVLISI